MRKRFKLKWFLPIVILILLFGVNWYYEFFAFNIYRQVQKESGTFRVMTFNINASRDIYDVEVFKKGLIAEIEKQNPDILCLQELSLSNFLKIQSSLDSLFGYTDSLEIKKEVLRYCLYSKKPIRKFKRYKCLGSIDTTGFDISAKKEIAQIRKQMPVYSIEAEVEKDKWVTVFSCHFRSNAYTNARRSMSNDAFWAEGIPLYISNYRVGKTIRNYEADNIRRYIDSLTSIGTPIIIAGDLNTSWNSYCLQTIKGECLKDAWWSGGLGLGFTYDAWHLNLRLDHILYSQQLKLQNVFVEKSSFSDHRPLIADFELQ